LDKFIGQSLVQAVEGEGQCCQPCGFPANLGLLFCGIAGFLKACGLLVLGLILIEIRLFFGVVFRRFLFCGLLCFQIL